MNKPALKELQVKLRALSGPSREIDGWIYLLVDPSGVQQFAWPETQLKVPWPQWIENWKDDKDAFPQFTRSVDAALALVAKVLPGWRWNLYSDGTASVYLEHYASDGIDGEGRTPALAIVQAALSALIENAHD